MRDLVSCMIEIEQARKAKQSLMHRLDGQGISLAVGIGKDRRGYLLKVHLEQASGKASLPDAIEGVPVKVEITGKAKARGLAG